MGCICSKGFFPQEYIAENHVREKILKTKKATKRLGPTMSREEAVVEVDSIGNDFTTRLISNSSGEIPGSTPVLWNEGEKKVVVKEKLGRQQLQRRLTMDFGVSGAQLQPRLSRIGSLPHGERGAQVIAGWPSWLTAVAGEAINGWVPRKADSFEKLDKIGQGTYSSVYRARDLETNRLVALKKVRFANMDPESVRFMAREIIILRRLDHPNVMKLEGLITSRVSGSLYLIFEYMEHDLAGLAATTEIKFTEAQIKCFMQQLLCGLDHCHSHGILHRDIKGSNLLIDQNGNLKIGDFGLATFFNQKQPLTSRVVTLWYRPPELLLGATDYGVSVDLWSTGCILAELFAGKPIMPGRTEVEQLHKIFKLCGSPSEEYWKKSKLPHATIFKPQHPYKRIVAETFKDFPTSALALLEVLLAIEPEGRGTASSALQSEFFTTKPLPCDPSTLPKYAPSKEFDVRLRDEEARRRKADGGVGRERESTRSGLRESKAMPAPDANAELQASIQKRLLLPNPKSASEKYNTEEDGGSGFPIEPPKRTALNVSHSGQSMHPAAFGSSHNMNENDQEATTVPGQALGCSNGAELRSQRSCTRGEEASQGDSLLNRGGETTVDSHWPDEDFNVSYKHLDDSEVSEKSQWSHHLLDRPTKSLYKKDQRSSGKLSGMGYNAKKNRIQYSGPLMPLGGNLDEMLKEHERQIQHAVRKARLDKTKSKKTSSENGQTESLLYAGSNGK
ncbi:probable serine/threonine-protein kinase At1g09600 [Quercus suber]|uniref:probable serine/threonine-protein kinase At1g09600 n=2 Tax=Quercus suber TaxID=58331 RepID=UPI000CE20E99|nr:probable serine/threonine-protein kinase At1g09600 [Quercus suber]XP_023916907.1 probable serine/threonine-protein kinase At1g09600 [Quercus suber]